MTVYRTRKKRTPIEIKKAVIGNMMPVVMTTSIVDSPRRCRLPRRIRFRVMVSISNRGLAPEEQRILQ